MQASDRERDGAVVVLSAPAKLTRRLRVLGQRPDGYHLLDAEMVTLELADELQISSGQGLEVIDEIDWIGHRAALSLVPAGANLVERALQVVGRAAHVQLRKRIPAGAGLGGGSADAAAVLRWARCSDLELAASLGADVPFCLAGGRARVRGIGEIVEPLPSAETHVLLVVPQLAVSTMEVYAAWDSLGGPNGDYGNDLEPAALLVEPKLAWWRDLVGDAAGERPRLAGSGGTWWLEGERDGLVRLQERVAASILGAGESAVVQVIGTSPTS
jgi:4-diphosphocytidyl-2-C-methyl-D-erythritol kinase